LQWLWTKGYFRVEPVVGWCLGDYRVRREVDCLFAWKGGVAPACRWSCILLAAAYGGHAEVVRFLIGEVGIPLPSRGGTDALTALHLACRGGHDEAVRVLLELGMTRYIACWREQWTYPVTPLMEAACSGSMSCTQRIGEFGMDIERCTPAVTIAAEAGHADIVGWLLRKTPGVDTDEAFGVAVVHGNLPIVRMLSGRSAFAWTPRSWRALWMQSDERFVQLLSERANGAFDDGVGDRLHTSQYVPPPDAWSRLELLLRVRCPSRGLAERIVRDCCTTWRPGLSVSDELSRLLVSLRLRAGRAFERVWTRLPQHIMERILGPGEGLERALL
jgi:hypothetical protein